MNLNSERFCRYLLMKDPKVYFSREWISVFTQIRIFIPNNYKCYELIAIIDWSRTDSGLLVTIGWSVS